MKAEKNSIIKKKIITYELIGFILTIFLLWASEVFDIPHNILGFEATPINWAESVLETVFVVMWGGFTIWTSKRLLERIKYLEGFLRVCTFCKRIRFKDKWIPIDVYLQDKSDTTISHGLCSDCLKKHYGISGD